MGKRSCEGLGTWRFTGQPVMRPAVATPSVRLRGDRCLNGYAAALRGGVCKDASAGKCDAHFGLRGLSLEGLAACG